MAYRPPNAIASTVEKETRTDSDLVNLRMPSKLSPFYLELDHSADGCLAVILFRMRSDMLMRQIK